MENSPIKQSPFPRFTKIYPEEIETILKQKMTENRSTLNRLLENSHFTYQNLMLPLEDMEDDLSRFWSSFAHLHSVMESEKVRAAYNACIPLLTEYHTELLQNKKLYNATKQIAESSNFETLNGQERKVIENDLRDFHLAGVDLPPEKKAQMAELQKKLSQLSTKFAENILDATNSWYLHIKDRDTLLGLPDQILMIAEENAKIRGLSGWVFTLDHASYATVMKYLAHREYRWLMYQAYVTRASDQGPQAGQFDNTAIIDEILKRRHELANLLGFKSYAEYSLKTKMADSPNTVLKFLNDLVERSKETAGKEMKELVAFAKATDGIERMEAWDVAYYSEKLRMAKYAISDEEIRSYFPIQKVLSGMFNVIHQLYGLRVEERFDVETWHPDVQFFEIYDLNNQLRGYFYTDLYARAHKREGAWMDDCQSRRRLQDGTIQLPIAFLTCNFRRPVEGKSALLNMDEVLTLFHEFGHCLHHIVTTVDRMPVSGINGVLWDAVEFPSQFFEFWCYEKETLQLISSHVDTGEPLSDALFRKIHLSKNFQSGMQMLRQLEFALFDLEIHHNYDPHDPLFVQKSLDAVRAKVSVFIPPAFNRFQHSFAHIFAGSYAAGYYSYKWSEVLSADAFSKFEEKGIFNRSIGLEFLQNILEQGGVKNPMELYIHFRGRPPSVAALLKYSGL